MAVWPDGIRPYRKPSRIRGSPGPDEWNYEHEAEVPEVFRDPDAVKPRARKHYPD